LFQNKIRSGVSRLIECLGVCSDLKFRTSVNDRVEIAAVFSAGKECLLREGLGALIRQHCYGYGLTDSCP